MAFRFPAVDRSILPEPAVGRSRQPSPVLKPRGETFPDSGYTRDLTTAEINRRYRHWREVQAWERRTGKVWPHRERAA